MNIWLFFLAKSKFCSAKMIEFISDRSEIWKNSSLRITMKVCETTRIAMVRLNKPFIYIYIYISIYMHCSWEIKKRLDDRHVSTMPSTLFPRWPHCIAPAEAMCGATVCAVISVQGCWGQMFTNTFVHSFALNLSKSGFILPFFWLIFNQMEFCFAQN